MHVRPYVWFQRSFRKKKSVFGTEHREICLCYGNDGASVDWLLILLDNLRNRVVQYYFPFPLSQGGASVAS